MIEVKMSFPNLAALAAFMACVTEPARSQMGAPVIGAGQPAASPAPSPDLAKQQDAARTSAQAGTAHNAEARAAATGKGKPKDEPKADKPKDEPKPETPKEDAKPAVTYENSGIAERIARAQAKDKAATIALLEKFNARNAEGKLKGSALKPEQFDDFIAEIDALLAGGDSLE